MQPALIRFLARRTLRAVVLVFCVSSAVLLLVHLAPPEPAPFGPGSSPASIAAERARLGLDRPFLEQYGAWLRRVAAFDFGESSRFGLPVATLLKPRMGRTLVLGLAALAIAIGLGLPAGVLTGSAPRRWPARIVTATSLLLVATPPLVTALVLLLIAARTGLLPTGGLEEETMLGTAAAMVRYLPLPALALALPIAAVIERIQSRALAEALGEPCIAAALSRGVSRRRAIWTHAFRLSLKPVIGVMGIVVGTVLSGSFIVEMVMTWPGLGYLMYQALVARDLYLAAGCAGAGAACLALGLFGADVALLMADPRTAETA